MRFRPILSATVCLASSAIFVAASAQNGASRPARKVPAVPSETQNGVVNVSGENSITDADTGISRLTKNVVVSQVGEDFILYAQSLVYNDPQRRAIATNQLRVETRDSTIKGQRIEADFNAKTLVMTGDVRISTHGKGDGITGNRNSLRARATSRASKLFCNRVDWDYETREAVLTGNIRMEQGKSRGTCERIEFDERQNVARLLGNVRFVDEKGQVFNTPDLTIYIDENRIVTGRSRIRILPNTATAAAPRPVKAPVEPKRAPVISEEDLKLFDVKPSPIPTLRPQPTEAPIPGPAPETAEEPTTAEN